MINERIYLEEGKENVYLDVYVDNGLKFELHVYPGKGNHGVALANEMTSCSNEKSVDGAMAKWVENAVIWSKGIK